MVMKLYDLQAKAGPLPGNLKCSQSKRIHFLYLSTKMHSQPTFQLQVFILVVSLLRSSAWGTPGGSFGDVKHCAHLGISSVSPPGTELPIWVYWPHLKRLAVVSGFQPEDSCIISNYENQAYSHQVKAENKRHIYQRAFERICKVKNTGSPTREGTLFTAMEHHSSSPTDCTETSHPTESLKTQITCRNFSALYLSVTFSSVTKVCAWHCYLAFCSCTGHLFSVALC